MATPVTMAMTKNKSAYRLDSRSCSPMSVRRNTYKYTTQVNMTPAKATSPRRHVNKKLQFNDESIFCTHPSNFFTSDADIIHFVSKRIFFVICFPSVDCSFIIYI